MNRLQSIREGDRLDESMQLVEDDRELERELRDRAADRCCVPAALIDTLTLDEVEQLLARAPAWRAADAWDLEDAA